MSNLFNFRLLSTNWSVAAAKLRFVRKFSVRRFERILLENRFYWTNFQIGVVFIAFSARRSVVSGENFNFLREKHFVIGVIFQNWRRPRWSFSFEQLAIYHSEKTSFRLRVVSFPRLNRYVNQTNLFRFSLFDWNQSDILSVRSVHKIGCFFFYICH